MISIIIPTMWYSDNILKTIDSFMSYDSKGSSEISGLKVAGEFSVTSKNFKQEYLQKEFKYWDETINKINKKYGIG